MAPGSYIIYNDAISKYLKAHVPGIREISNHLYKFCIQAFKNNGLIVNKRDIRDRVLQCLKRDILDAAVEEAKKYTSTNRSCLHTWKPFIMRASRLFYSHNKHKVTSAMY